MTDPIELVEQAGKQPAGWYPYHGGQRFWNGEEWTEHLAPPPPPSVHHLTASEIGGAVLLGILGAWVVLRIGAEFAPHEVFLPVKFVVDPSDVPSFR